MNSKGEFGAATNIKTFSFVVATARQPLTVFRTERLREKTHYHAVDEEWMQAYAARIRAPTVSHRDKRIRCATAVSVTSYGSVMELP